MLPPPSLLPSTPQNNPNPIQTMTTISTTLIETKPATPIDVAKSKHNDHSAISTDDAVPTGQPAPLATLAPEDRDYLSEREDIVTVAVNSSIAASKALFEIFSYQGGILWKKDHDTFKQYCLKKWGYGKSHGSRLINTGRMVAELEAARSPIGDAKLPSNECQVRKLIATVPQDRQVECWNQIVGENDPASLSGTFVAAEAKKFLKQHHLVPKGQRPPDTSISDHEAAALTLLKKFRTALGKLTDPARFEAPLACIETRINGNTVEFVDELDLSTVQPLTQSMPHRLEKVGDLIEIVPTLDRGATTRGPLTSDVTREVTSPIFTPEHIANVMAADDVLVAPASVHTPPEHASPAAIAAPPHTASPPPPHASKSVLKVLLDKQVKEEGKRPTTYEGLGSPVNATPKIPGIDSAPLESTEESPKQGFWVKKSDKKVTDPEGQRGFEYQLMRDGREEGYPGLGEAKGKELQKCADAKNANASKVVQQAN